jgi:hypothetical protein
MPEATKRIAKEGDEKATAKARHEELLSVLSRHERLLEAYEARVSDLQAGSITGYHSGKQVPVPESGKVPSLFQSTVAVMGKQMRAGEADSAWQAFQTGVGKRLDCGTQNVDAVNASPGKDTRPESQLQDAPNTQEPITDSQLQFAQLMLNSQEAPQGSQDPLLPWSQTGLSDPLLLSQGPLGSLYEAVAAGASQIASQPLSQAVAAAAEEGEQR